MDFDLFSCTYENLNSLKFNELQKLSSQYRVNRRWAKKREIIDKLLFVRDQEFKKRNLITDEAEKNVDSQENIQWVDGNKIFSSDSIGISKNEETDRRLTYNVNKPTGEKMDRRLTFNIVKTEGNQKIARDNKSLEICDNIEDKRLTYNAGEMKEINTLQMNATETCRPKINIEFYQLSAPLEKDPEDTANITNKKGKNSTETRKQSVDNEKSNINIPQVYFNTQVDGGVLGASHNQRKKFTEFKSAKEKKLTIPYSRIPAQSGKSVVKELRGHNVRVKSSEKFPAENRLLKLRVNNIKKPHTVKEQDLKSANEVTDATESPVDLGNGSSTSKEATLKNELSSLNNTRRIQPRRKSKTEDNVLVTNLKSKSNLKFFSPTQLDMKNLKRISDGNKCNVMNCGSKITKIMPTVEPQMSLTAKKMPNFSKIHQKQFEQMDSILDYKRKREERVKKLFGIPPQPGIFKMVNKGNKSSELFQFKSYPNEKENQFDKLSRTIIKPLQTDSKQCRERPKRQDMMNSTGNKSNIVRNVKGQNRKHLNGVRTNKRFELQMKFRKMSDLE